MTRRRITLLLCLATLVAVVVAAQLIHSRNRSSSAVDAGPPTVARGTNVLSGITVVPKRIRGHDYQRGMFGESWTDDTDAPGGRNGCDTRNDILNRDLVDKTYKRTSRCPNAVATGVLRDPYTSTTVDFTRGDTIGQAVQIDHIVPLAYAWDMGARGWTPQQRARFANDPANLLAVQGKANQDKGDLPPGSWMPPNHAFWCQYSVQFIEVLRGYDLEVDQRSARALRDAAATCPRG